MRQSIISPTMRIFARVIKSYNNISISTTKHIWTRYVSKAADGIESVTPSWETSVYYHSLMHLSVHILTPRQMTHSVPFNTSYRFLQN